MKKLLLITLLLPGYISIGQVNSTERDALIALYDATDGEDWIENTNWNTSDPVSSWFGITVENIAGQDHVTEIDLRFNNLTGFIPKEIGNLQKLKVLNFWVNNLSGTIPSEIGNCTNLEVLSFEENELTGNIPDSFANLTNMQAFWINDNQFSGEIPNFFTGWENLVRFSIGDFNNIAPYNNFTGTLYLCNNSKLDYCNVSFNNLSEVYLQNGNNANVLVFDARNNPNLTDVYVDNVNYSSESSRWDIDNSTKFSETSKACPTLSIEDLYLDSSSFSVYPNPTANYIDIKNSGNSKIKSITLVNPLGQTIIETKKKSNINVSHLPIGVYIINIETIDGKKTNYRIIKQ